MSRPHKTRLTYGRSWRTKKATFEGDKETLMDDLMDNNDHTKDLMRNSCHGDVEEFVSIEEFEKEVAKKTQTMLFDRKEAEIKVSTDILIREKGNVDKALLYVVSILESETRVQMYVNNLISRGATGHAVTSENKKTPLHYAVYRKFKGVAAKLLEHNAFPHARDQDGTIPLGIAIKYKQDEMGALLLKYMPNAVVRKLFIGEGERKAEFSLHTLLRTDLQIYAWNSIVRLGERNVDQQFSVKQTIISVLDCMIEPDGSGDNIKVYYNVLEADENGRPPDDDRFKEEERSPLQIIAKQGNKNIVYHDAIRLLIRRKWKHYAQRRFELISCLYILSLFCLTYSAVVAVKASDPLEYDTPLQISRGIFEVASLLMAIQTLVSELNQLKRNKLEYFTEEGNNWMDLSSTILIISVVPLRIAQHNRQWHVFAVGYLVWTIRIFKYAAVFRQTGAYARVLYMILRHDFLQFAAVFLVILLAFSGAFFLSLRGEHDLDTHYETSSFWGILYVGIRTLTEAQPVVDYTGEDGYSALSQFLMLCFLLTCYVILLNILIAQLTDTYQNVQQDAQRGLEVTMAWIVARVELHTLFFGQDFRKNFYTEYEYIRDLKNVLRKWDSPPINEMNKYVRDIWDSLDNQNMNLLTVKHRLATQENSLRNIQESLDRLIQQQASIPQQQSASSSIAIDLNTSC